MHGVSPQGPRFLAEPGLQGQRRVTVSNGKGRVSEGDSPIFVGRNGTVPRVSCQCHRPQWFSSRRLAYNGIYVSRSVDWRSLYPFASHEIVLGRPPLPLTSTRARARRWCWSTAIPPGRSTGASWSRPARAVSRLGPRPYRLRAVGQAGRPELLVSAGPAGGRLGRMDRTAGPAADHAGGARLGRGHRHGGRGRRARAVRPLRAHEHGRLSGHGDARRRSASATCRCWAG